MSDIDIAQQAARGTELAACANAIENAIVGVMAVLLEDEALDEEVQEIIHGLRTRAHRLRRIASLLNRAKR